MVHWWWMDLGCKHIPGSILLLRKLNYIVLFTTTADASVRIFRKLLVVDCNFHPKISYVSLIDPDLTIYLTKKKYLIVCVNRSLGGGNQRGFLRGISLCSGANQVIKLSFTFQHVVISVYFIIFSFRNIKCLYLYACAYFFFFKTNSQNTVMLPFQN